MRALRFVLGHLESRGADPEHLLPRTRRIGVDFSDEDARISALRLHGLWVRAAQALGDPCVGLHTAEAADASSFGVFSFLAVTSAKWRDSIERVIRYQRLMDSGARYGLHIEQGAATYEVEAPLVPGGDRRHLVEFSVAVAFCYSERHVDAPWAPRAVTFTHESPPDPSEHHRVFGRPVRFGAERNGFTFDAELLDASMQRGDAALSATLEAHARELAARVPGASDPLEVVRRRIAQSLPGGDVSLAAVAGRLGTTPRTLQRRLKEGGTSHQALLDEVRMSTARRLLADPGLPLCEVAFLLGFSQPAPFHRAFKRWTGETPGAFRRRTTEA